MPNSKLMRHKETGEYYLVTDGRVVKATPEALQNIGMLDPDTMGVDWSERFVLKNLASNPASARGYLRKLGYQVIPIGNSMNFMVRSSEDEPFKVVDPKGFGRGGSDILYDLLDLTMDVATGVITGAGATAAGAVSGGVGALAGAGVAGGLSELARQGLGEAAGIENNIDPTQAALVGGVSAATVPAGAIAGKALRAVGRGATEFLGRITGIRAPSGISAAETLRSAQAWRAQTEFRTPGQVASAIKDRIVKIRGTKMAEQFEIDDIVLNHGDKPVSVVNMLQRLRGGNVDRDIFDATARDQARSVMDDVKSILKIDFDDIADDDIFASIAKRKITFNEAEKIRSSMSKLVSDVGGWQPNKALGTPRKAKQQWVSNLKQAYHALRMDMADSLGRQPVRVIAGVDRSGREIIRNVPLSRYYSDTMARLSNKLGRLEWMAKNFGGDNAESRVLNAFGTGKERFVDGVRLFDQAFGDDWVGILKMVAGAKAVNSNIARFGQPQLLPRLTATGGILGASLFASGAGPLGYLGGAALASPKVALGLHGMGSAIGGATQQALASPAARKATITALQAAARDERLFPTARETHKPVVRLR